MPKINLGLLRMVIVCSLLSLIGGSGVAYADTYNVNAVVPYEAPTKAATITSPSEAKGTVVYDAEQTISGTCQLQNPRAIVSIWKAQVVLGSAECTDGTFSIPVVLYLGENNLVVKTANANGLYGPDSTKVMIQLKKPTNANPLPEGVDRPTTIESHQAATNQGGISGLTVTTEAPYTVLSNVKVASIHVVVGGGQRPYVLQLKWGDGSTEAHSIDQAGTYEFTHEYTFSRSYGVNVYLRDVLGAYTEYTYAVVSGEKVAYTAPTTTGSSAPTNQSTEPWRLVGVVWYYWLIIIAIIAFLFTSYRFGYRRGKERSEIGAKKYVIKKKKRSKK